MEIVLFCTSRTTAREKAKEVQGKVKDFGSDAKAGERWAVLYEMPDDVQVPVWVEDQTVDPVLVDLANKELLQTGLEQFMDSKIKDLDIPEGTKIVAGRPILKAPCKPKGKSNIRTGMMKSRKGSLIQVQFKRSTLTAMIAAEMHRLK